MVSPPSTVASDDQSADYSNHCRSVRCLQETLMVSPPSITATDDQSTGYNSRNHLRSFLTSQMDFYFHIMREFLDLLKNHYFLRTVLRGAGWCCLSVILYSDKEIFRRCIFDTSARHWLTLRLHATDWRYVCAPLTDIMSSRHWLTSARHWLMLRLHATDWRNMLHDIHNAEKFKLFHDCNFIPLLWFTYKKAEWYVLWQAKEKSESHHFISS